jgi:hypothetical protein
MSVVGMAVESWRVGFDESTKTTTGVSLGSL